MLIISHSELDSYISCNIQWVRVYTSTLYYSYREVAILCSSYNLGLLFISSFPIYGLIETFKSEIGNTSSFSNNEKKRGSRTGKQQLASEVSVQCFAP